MRERHTPIKNKHTKLVHIWEQAYDCYIGEPHTDANPKDIPAGQHGFLANPFTEGSHEENLALFENYFHTRLKEDRLFRLAVLSLYGKTLGCICEIKNCHGHIIIDWLEGNKKSYQSWFGLRQVSK